MSHPWPRLDRAYCTRQPIILNCSYGRSLALRLHFAPDNSVAFEFHLDDGDECEELYAGTTTYKWVAESRMRFHFNAGWWETEWEGSATAEELPLTYRMEVHSGDPAAICKCLIEGETTLSLAPPSRPGMSPSGER